VLIELLIGANAVWGGIMLMTDSWNLGHGWLDNTLFESWFLPGVALLVIIGGTQPAAAVTLLARRPYAPAPGAVVATLPRPGQAGRPA
jgi:hypothetical protein